MKVYVASSWRNERQQAVVRALRDAGHDVYDFRNPAPGDHGFSWRSCATEEQLRDPRRFRDEVLTHPVARAAFEKDMNALMAADAVVLVLPCGRSAHLELGYATPSQRTIVLLDDPISEPELMYLMNDSIAVSLEEVLDRLKATNAVPVKVHEWVRELDRPSPSHLRRRVVYVAHPLGAGPDRDSNRAKASRWCAWVMALGHAPVADWIILAERSETPESREAGLAVDVALVERCDELWLVGERISPGMKVEADAAHRVGILVVDLTELGSEPPGDLKIPPGKVKILHKT